MITTLKIENITEIGLFLDEVEDSDLSIIAMNKTTEDVYSLTVRGQAESILILVELVADLKASKGH